MNDRAPSTPPPSLSVTAIIPARGGSKGVPGKNLRRLAGRTLVARSIHAARGARAVSSVVVTTDDPAIAAESERHGALVIVRPPELATDTASSEDALLHALDALPDDVARPDVLAFLQCTSPFTTAADVDAVLEPVLRGDYDCSFSAAAFHGFVWTPTAGGAVGVNHDHTGPRQRRQDRPVEVLETGAVYAFVADGFARARSRFFGRIEAVVVDERGAMEIDTFADLELAEAVAHAGGIGPGPDLVAPALVALDFDGVFTDNTVHVDEHGVESVTCHRGDGHGLAALRRHVPVVVFSTEVNPVVSARCRKLGIEAVQGLGAGKRAALERYAADRDIDLRDVLFVGNDVNDLECLAAVGTPVAVADAVPEVLASARLVLGRPGGHGALRELSDLLLPLVDATSQDDDEVSQ
jgi:YrbI family 3-deoxy-D-manno-octulosonate 8-phosphate phosphatase